MKINIKKQYLVFFLGFVPLVMGAQEFDMGFSASSGVSIGGGSGLALNGGFFIEKPLEKKLALGAGLGVSYLSVVDNNFKKLIFGTDIINEINGIPSQSYLKTEYESRLTYVSVPFFIKYTPSKFSINAGLNFLFYSVGHSKVKSELNESGNISYTEKEEEIDRNLIENNFGPQIGIEYKLTHSLAVRGDIFYGLSKIQNGTFSSQKNIGQAVIGLNYYLTKSSVN